VEIPQHLQDLVLAEANLEKDGLEAFRRGDYHRCVQIMNKIVDRQKNNWQVRLYLAMSHYSIGDIFTGAIHFRYLEQNCPDEDIRARSRSALAAMEREIKTPRRATY
jgi:hypothetical protein